MQRRLKQIEMAKSWFIVGTAPLERATYNKETVLDLLREEKRNGQGSVASANAMGCSSARGLFKAAQIRTRGRRLCASREEI